jgi:hypothetical protein
VDARNRAFSVQDSSMEIRTFRTVMMAENSRKSLQVNVGVGVKSFEKYFLLW